jgi:hypothetical protein
MKKQNTPKAKTIPQQRMEARRQLLEGSCADETVSEDQKLTIITALSEGAILTEITAIKGMPRASAVWRECERDPTFGDAVRQARVAGAHAILDEAQHNLREAADSGDTDRMRIASLYSQASTAYVEKIAPKEYGPLVKHAGADGGSILVQVVDYAAVEAGALTVESRLIGASEQPDEE